MLKKFGMRKGTRWVTYGWILCLVCLAGNSGGGAVAHAALLDELLSPVEKAVAERVAKRGETVTVGNFYTPDRPDSHGPMGTMGEHTHNKGEFMFTYRYMFMEMEDMRIGTNRVSNADVLKQFMVTPTRMTMEMHMFMPMYGLTDTLTVMAMVPYVKKSMDHRNRMGKTFQTNSEGIGDLQLWSLWRLYAIEAPSIGAHRFHLNFGLSVPTGSITERDNTPTGNQRLPYPMQLGSGTVDLLPGITYSGMSRDFSWGTQFLYTARLGRNSEDYSLGDAWFLTGWGAYRWADWISTSVRLNYMDWGNINGRDQTLANPAAKMVPTVDPNNQGGERLDVLAGINILFPPVKGVLNHLNIEAGVPIYQRLDGPQLETDWTIFVGWQFVR